MPLPKFPRQALQVLRIIRAEVPRPEELPEPIKMTDGHMSLRFVKSGKASCPMGHHPKSEARCPVFARHFAAGRCKGDNVWSFARWWDSIPVGYAQAAIDFIWKGGDQ